MKLEKVGIVETGQMGGGIAQVAATAGRVVFPADVNRDVAKKGNAILVRRGPITVRAATARDGEDLIRLADRPISVSN
jgi:3-hydroxyacyl-CoA dehydrogenase